MASIGQGEYRTKLAGEDLSSSQYMFVTLETDDQVDLADAITDKVYGVLQNAPAAGEEAVIKVSGETKVVASAALANGVYVGPATTGKAQTAVATQFPRGVIVSPSGADLDLAVIELFHSGAALA